MVARRLKHTVRRRLGIDGLRAAHQQLDASYAALNHDVLAVRSELAAAVATSSNELSVVQSRLSDAERRADDLLTALAQSNSVLWASLWHGLGPAPSATRVSVVMPTRNRASLLPRAIEAVLRQSHTELELIVVDDGSSDETAAVLQRLAEPRMVVLQGGGQGAASARNLGLEHATGSLLAFADDDNVMAPWWLAAACHSLDVDGTTTAVYGAQLREPEGGGDIEMLYRTPFDRALLAKGPYIDLGAVVVRAGTPGLWFDTDLAAVIDWDMLLRISRAGTITAIPVLSGAYTTSAPDRITNRPDKAAAIETVRRRAAETA